MQNWLRPAILEAVQELKPIAAEAGCSLTQFSGLCAARAEAIAGASRQDAQLNENAGDDRAGQSTRSCS